MYQMNKLVMFGLVVAVVCTILGALPVSAFAQQQQQPPPSTAATNKVF